MSNPRIIAGSARGTRLEMVPGTVTRPITDMVKEALFNILGSDIMDGAMLDLFGGTGSVGIEALSRGAQYVRMIDLDRGAVATMRANLEKTHLTHKAEVVQADTFAILGRKPDRQFDYVYIAPPQYKDLWTRALHALDQSPAWMKDNAWVIVQIDPVEYAPQELQTLEEIEQRKYGSTLLVFYEVKEK